MNSTMPSFSRSAKHLFISKDDALVPVKSLKQIVGELERVNIR